MYHIRFQATHLCLLIFFLLITPGKLLASEDTQKPSPIRFSTFGTLGITLGPDNLSPKRGIGQRNTFHDGFSWKHDSLLGLQVDADILPSLSATAQLVLKERPENSVEESIEWLFVSWRPNNSFTLRGGRLGPDFHMLADYRNVSYAYLWQRPPTEFYGMVLMDNFEGIDISYGRKLGQGNLHFKVFGGIADQPIQLDSQELEVIDPKMKPFYGGRLWYEISSWQLSTSYASITFDEDLAYFADMDTYLANPLLQHIWPDAAKLRESLQSDGKDAAFYSLGLCFDDNTWLIQAELGHIESEWHLFPSTTSAYLSVGRRFGLYTPYVVLATVRPDSRTFEITPPPTGVGLDEISASLDPLIAGMRMEQDTLSLGVRRDVGQNIAIKLQWDHTQIAEGGDKLWWNNGESYPSPEQDVDVFSLSINWMFLP